MASAFIVTFIGDDRPGLVEELSRTIERSGGNWHESRLAQLGGKFTGLVRVSLPEARGETLEAALRELAASGLSVRVTPCAASTAAEPGRDIELTLIGPDRPGIVHEVSRALAARRVNVVEMDSEVTSAPMSAEPLFRACIRARIPETTDMAELEVSLDVIAEQMTLEIDLA